MRVSGLAVYPVKSLQGFARDAAVVDPRGLAGDRRWLVVDARGRFVTRREVSAMAWITVDATADGLVLRHPELGDCAVRRPDADAPVVDATVWRSTLPLRLCDDGVAAWLSAALGRAVRLAHQFDASHRAIDPRFAEPGDQVSLADGFPLLVTTEASLAALNDRLSHPVTMARFRPNIVVTGAEAWAEDGWQRIRIGAVTLRLARPCARCIVITQDPDSGERRNGDEPLATLRAMGRMMPGGIMFGQNAVPERLGSIRVGDAVELLD